MLKAVVFDMDGLLLDTERIAVDAWAQAAKEMGLTLPEAAVLSTVGLDLNATIGIVSDALGQAAPIGELQTRMLMIYRRRLDLGGVPVKAGAEELLRRLAESGIPAGLATSTARSAAEWKMRSAGLLRYIAGSACGDEVQRGKPFPDIFLLAARKIGVKPEQCVALEDSPAGVMAAKAAGMTTILVPDLAQPTAESLPCADHAARDLSEAAKLIFGVLMQTGGRMPCKP
jgi:HAD superfamily hydrolase (TIGR01509 family)